VLLIGERPGLATAESLSAYMAYRPCPGDDDSRRNLISNIHVRGVPCDQAALRIAGLAEQMIRLRSSGVAVKELGLPEAVLTAGSPPGPESGLGGPSAARWRSSQHPASTDLDTRSHPVSWHDQPGL
jgi:hypothetical protein